MPGPRPSQPGSKDTGESRAGSTSVRDVVFDEDRHQLRIHNGPFGLGRPAQPGHPASFGWPTASEPLSPQLPDPCHDAPNEPTSYSPDQPPEPTLPTPWEPGDNVASTSPHVLRRLPPCCTPQTGEASVQGLKYCPRTAFRPTPAAVTSLRARPTRSAAPAAPASHRAAPAPCAGPAGSDRSRPRPARASPRARP